MVGDEIVVPRISRLLADCGEMETDAARVAQFELDRTSNITAVINDTRVNDWWRRQIEHVYPAKAWLRE
jgi:hypothetical protein